MERISERAVHLSLQETITRAVFEDLLNQGMGIPLAAKLALNDVEHNVAVVHSADFAEWLSEGTVKRWGDRWLVKAEWRAENLPKPLPFHVPARAVRLIPVEFRS